MNFILTAIVLFFAATLYHAERSRLNPVPVGYLWRMK
jgi:hypothetical protein